MNFWNYLEKTGQSVQSLSDAAASRFAALMSRGHSVADLLGHYADEFSHLPKEQLIALARAHRQWMIWQRRYATIAKARTAAKVPELPLEVIKLTTTPDELDAIARCARCCTRTSTDDATQWEDALRASLDLWRACIKLTRRSGKISCKAHDRSTARGRASDHFDAYLNTTETLDDIAPHRWLAMRRGSRQKALALSLELPRAQFDEQLALHQAKLVVGDAADREPQSLLEELVIDDLEPWLFSIIDAEAEGRAIQAACESLSGLLSAAPLQVRRIGGVHISRATSPIAAVVLDREGDVVSQKVLRPEGTWASRLVEFFAEPKTNHIVLPTSAPASELIAALEAALGEAGAQVQRIRPAALAEARLPLTNPPLRLGASVASAAVLARRALDPVKAWATVDPVSIGVAEYQNDLEQEKLRAALTETLELCRLERRKGGKVGSAPSTGVRASAAMARLNPLVKTIADLRAGMSVQGVVTNISHFGAFVGIGLGQEGLVHISELSDDYVANPNDVVKIGQQVTAHVLSCDPARGRISLSMKSVARRMPATGKSTSSDGPSRARPPSRNQALADLERLFKK